MKKYFLVICFVGIILHLHSINSYAGFLFKLKNGRTISAESYQIEGDRIILYLERGSLKISKDEVQSILETKEEVKEEIEKEGVKEEKKEGPKYGDQKDSAADSARKKEEIDSYIKRKAELVKRLEEAKKAYFNATDKSEKETARGPMISISRELFSLQEEVMKRNKGILPEWWKEN
jgi:hypothetical protein